MRRIRHLTILAVALIFSAVLASFGGQTQAPKKFAATTSKPPLGAQQASAKSKSSKSKKGKRQRQAKQKAPTPDRIREIQSALAREGTYQGDPTGKWDANTSEAMKRYQGAHGLNPSGKFDALSLQRLGLGSEIAGRAAPRPPLPATLIPPR